MARDVVEFDPFSETFFDDPYETYSWLRDNDPVHFNSHYGFYTLSRHADVVAAHSDPTRLVSSYGSTVEMLVKKQKIPSNMMIFLDPPEHTQVRRLVNQAFSRRTIEGLEPLVTGTITRCLDHLEGLDRFDVVTDFAALFPVEVISAMLGVPSSERQQLRHWTDTFLYRRPGDPRTTQEGMEAAIEMASYFLELARHKRKQPDDMIISKLNDVVISDVDGPEHRLSDEDVAALSSLMAAAGSETVTKLVGSAVVLFDEHPEQWELVVADEQLIPSAVEEALRMHPPSQYQGRFAIEDITFEGGTIPAGSPTLLLTGAATRDPRVFERPDDFVVTRNSHTSLAFGFGIHSCLGAWLARLESRVAFGQIRRRWPRFEVDREGLRRVNMSNVAGYSNVPVAVG